MLLLEDDSDLATTIKEILDDAGYYVDLASDGGEAAELSYDNSYDLYVFDINVPDINGIELLKGLRDAGDNTPTIYITALVDLDSITKAFNAGADDYIKKPFYPEELLIRIDSKLAKSDDTVIIYNDIRYNPATKEIFKDDKIVSLGSVQIKLFDILIQNVGKMVLKEDLLDLLENPSNTALRVAMTKLKQKLSLDITNVRGMGYIIEKV